jgi:hypothetical protein
MCVSAAYAVTRAGVFLTHPFALFLRIEEKFKLWLCELVNKCFAFLACFRVIDAKAMP